MLREWQFPVHWGGRVIGFGDGQAPRVPGRPWQNEYEAGLLWLGHNVSPQVFLLHSGTSVPRYQSSAVHPALAARSRRGRAGTSSSCMAPGSSLPQTSHNGRKHGPEKLGAAEAGVALVAPDATVVLTRFHCPFVTKHSRAPLRDTGAGAIKEAEGLQTSKEEDSLASAQ